MQFYPYIPSAPGSFKKRFNTIGTTDWDGNPELDEMLGISRDRDLSQVRNDVTIIGIDPVTWKPIVAHNRDDDSISNIAAANFLGYRAPMVWADSMFCTPDYAGQALDQTFNVARLPLDTINLFGWMQSRLFPLDVISAYDSYSTDIEKPYYITDISNTLIAERAQNGVEIRPFCTIKAQWLTPWG